MHIPDGFLSPGVWGSLDLAGAGLATVGVRRLSRRLDEGAIPLMGVLAAFVFAAQLINLPIAGGTSVHFLGGTLLGALLGPWSGMMVMAAVLAVQCFLFQDGGVAALGANFFNMAFIGSVLGGLFYSALRATLRGPRGIFWSGFLAAWAATLLSALACAAELFASKVIPLKLGLSVIGGVHVLLGLLEGLVTGTMLESVARRRPDLLARGRV